MGHRGHTYKQGRRTQGKGGDAEHLVHDGQVSAIFPGATGGPCRARAEELPAYHLARSQPRPAAGRSGSASLPGSEGTVSV